MRFSRTLVTALALFGGMSVVAIIERGWVRRRGTGVAGRAFGSRWWREILFVLGFYAVYDSIRGLMTGDVSQAERNGNQILDLERCLHLTPEHLLNDAFDRVPVLAVMACLCYATLHFIVTAVVLVWCYRRYPGAYRRARIELGVITGTALVGFWWFPTAPPRLLLGAGYHDTLQQFSRWGWWGTDNGSAHGAAAIANQYAAMPSLHVSWAAWCAATVCRLVANRALRIVALCYPAVIAVVVIGTANHYLLDVVTGVLLCVLASTAVSLLSWLPVRPIQRGRELAGDLYSA